MALGSDRPARPRARWHVHRAGAAPVKCASHESISSRVRRSDSITSSAMHAAWLRCKLRVRCTCGALRWPNVARPANGVSAPAFRLKQSASVWRKADAIRGHSQTQGEGANIYVVSAGVNAGHSEFLAPGGAGSRVVAAYSVDQRLSFADVDLRGEGTAAAGLAAGALTTRCIEHKTRTTRVSPCCLLCTLLVPLTSTSRQRSAVRADTRVLP